MRRHLPSVDTVVKNTGGNVADFNKKLDAASKSASLFSKTDVADAMSNLTMATGNSTKALGMMSTVENMAIYKHESLAQASDQLDHILGGSTRTLLSWGINMNVSSGRLHSLQTEEEALQKATTNLQGVQENKNAGMLEGVAYEAAYKSAVLGVRDAHTNLQVAETTTARVLDLLNNRTKGAADMFGHTFAGQVQEARAQLTNLGISFGGDVVKGIQHLEVIVASVVSWLEKFKVVAIALGAVIVGVPVVGAFLYLYSVMTRIGANVLTLGGKFNTFGLQAKVTATGPQALTNSINQLNATMAASAAPTEAEQAAIELAGANATAASVEVKNLQLSFTEAGDSAQGSLFSIAAFDTALDTTAADAEVAATGIRAAFTSVLGPIGIVITGVMALVSAFGILKSSATSAFASANRTPVATQWQNAASGYMQQGDVKDWGASIKKWGQAVNATAGAANKATYGWVTESAADLATGAFVGDKRRQDPNWRAQGTGKTGQYPGQSAPIQVWTKTGTVGETPAQKKSEQAYIDAMNEYAGVMHMSAAKRKAWEAQQLANYNLQMGVGASLSGPALPKIPGMPGTPAAAGGQQDPRMVKFWAQQALMQQALQTGSIQSLRPQMQYTTGFTATGQQVGVGAGAPLTEQNLSLAKSANAGFNKMADEAKVLFKDGLTKQGNAILATYNDELKYYGALEADLKQTALNTDLQNANTQYQDQTAILTDIWTQATQKITDTSAVNSAKSTLALDLANDKNQEAVDKLGERGLYGLNLIAQEEKVGLDAITTKWTKMVDTASLNVAATTKAGNATVASAKLNMDTVQKKYDLSTKSAEVVNALAQKSGTTLKQVQSATGLTGKQLTAATAEYIADRAYAQAQAKAAKDNANAQAQLVATQNAAKIAEGKQERLIAIEQAKANTEFAGSGVHIEITGINPTDAAAVGAAVSWNLRTKVPK